MLPSGSMRPDHPTWNVSKSPASALSSAVVNSVGCSFTAKPASLAIDWMTWPRRSVTASVLSMRLTGIGGLRPLLGARWFGLAAALGDELLGLRDVAGRALDRLVEVRADRRDRPAARGVRPLEDDLVDRVAVELEAERLARLRVLGERRPDGLHRLAEPVLVADVDRQALVAQRRDVEQRQVGVGLDRLGRDRVEALADVDVARAQVRRPRGGLVDD